MKLNTKTRYGLRTMIEIAWSTKPEGVLQKDIAASQNISVKYLDSIIAALKLKGLIVNSKGRGSGYVLARPTQEITMLDIYTAFEPIIIVDCLKKTAFCKKTHECVTRNYWAEFKDDFTQILQKKTLAQILQHVYYEGIDGDKI